MKNLYPVKAERFAMLACLLIFFIASCKKDDVEPPPPPSEAQLYADAVSDAMVADSTEIVDTLWAIDKQDVHLQWKTINGKEYVLMATFMKYPDSYPEGDSITNSWGESWLFIPEQMKERLTPGFTAQSDTIQRICQLLGLPPESSTSNTHIAQVWVRSEQLFRPAGNASITTTTAPGDLVSGNPAGYETWFNAYIISSYYAPLNPGGYHYPWTRLGYTYDWAPGSAHVGLSEYVLRANSGMWVEKTQTAAAFYQ
ncbi:hypothetical protein [Compostibacter hankyongensis]|uniref:Uncharacterized protein n=1 Tax=Compostibacter hankyongensis TaxID=1007089 RepID=A0ABP8G5R0_9BACT